MTLGRIGCALAVIAILCVLTVFFFHSLEGPYSAVHGPATALLSARAAFGLRMAIIHAGVSALWSWYSFALVLISWAIAWIVESGWHRLSAGGNQILRC